MNQFSERYKTFSNVDLFRIIQNKGDYQEEALSAAELEVQRRNLTEQEITEASQELLEARNQLRQIKERKSEKQEEALNLVYKTIDAFNPLLKSLDRKERIIRLITIIFGLIAIVGWYNEIDMIRLRFSNPSIGFDMFYFISLIPIISLTLALVTFWLRRKIGWILMVAYFVYSVIGSFSLILLTWGIEPTGIAAIDDLMPRTTPLVYFITSLSYGITIWVLCGNEFLSEYKISKYVKLTTLFVSAILSSFFFFI